MTAPLVDDRDLCKRGCGIVHTVPCEAPGELHDGRLVQCERAFCHDGDHEWTMDPTHVATWPNPDDNHPTKVNMPDSPEPILQFFTYRHLPPELGAISKHFADLADDLVAQLPRNTERSVALRKLLEAKDAAVRARIYKEA
jgi:hypothetical protein